MKRLTQVAQDDAENLHSHREPGISATFCDGKGELLGRCVEGMTREEGDRPDRFASEADG